MGAGVEVGDQLEVVGRSSGRSWWWLGGVVQMEWFSHMSCLTLVTSWTVACQALLSMGFSRQDYWSGLPFPSPGDLPDPGIKRRSPALQADSLPTELWWKLQMEAHTQIWDTFRKMSQKDLLVGGPWQEREGGGSRMMPWFPDSQCEWRELGGILP